MHMLAIATVFVGCNKGSKGATGCSGRRAKVRRCSPLYCPSWALRPPPTLPLTPCRRASRQSSLRSWTTRLYTG
eukprot:4604-Heterococcus_DN1.PRE.2